MSETMRAKQDLSNLMHASMARLQTHLDAVTHLPCIPQAGDIAALVCSWLRCSVFSLPREPGADDPHRC